MLNAVLGDDLVVAKRAGQNLFLAGGPKRPVTFEGMGPGTLFFREADFGAEVKRLGVEEAMIEPVPVVVEVTTR